MNFVIPNSETITTALGDISKLPRDMQLAVKDQLETSFQPIRSPGVNDWLACHEEKGQSFKSFERLLLKAVPHGSHRTIYIQPVGSFDHSRAAPLDTIAQFARVFFSGCIVEVLPTVEFSKDMKHRDYYGTLQYRTDGFLEYLRKTRALRNSRCELICIAVTMADLYPDEEWNFVYGLASSSADVGVYSFARLDPLFSMGPERLKRIPMTDEHRITMLRRCVKILLHELGHLFGLRHCIYYTCLMNGANHEHEMELQPLYVCPICLHKLYSTLKFDVRTLYEGFANLCETYGLKQEADWYRTRLSYLLK